LSLDDEEKAVEELIAKDPTIVNEPDFLNRNPLIHAASAGDLEIIQILLDAGANTKAISDYNDLRIISGNALHHFIFGLSPNIDYHNQEKNLQIIQLLLDRGVEKNQVDMKGRTPYDLAKESNFSPYLLLLHDFEAAYQTHCETYPHAQKNTARKLDFSGKKTTSSSQPDYILTKTQKETETEEQEVLSETFSISGSDNYDDLPPLLPASPVRTSKHTREASQIFSSQPSDGLSDPSLASSSNKRQRTQRSLSQPLVPDDEASQFFSQSAHDELKQSMPQESPFTTRTEKPRSLRKDLIPVPIDFSTEKNHADQCDNCKIGQCLLSTIKN
jgi:hypothetical protein